MKKIVLLSCLALVFSASAFADAPAGATANAPAYKSAGCGLGSLVIKDDGFVQVFAATTNGTFGSQTFGISSGTSNCAGSGGIASADAKKNMYVSSNHDAITQEMAQGSGEHLNALSAIMGCDQASSARFDSVMQKNYRSIASDSSTRLLSNVKSAVAADPQLKKSCSI